MRKHRIDKIQEMSGASVELCPPDTPEETAALIAELLLIAERMPVEKIVPKNVTKYNSGDAEKIIPENLTVFNSEELRTLESLKNAEQ
jgi:hypothetical protein